uniref:Uncharacterized protein n=1 Tax=Arundo donax TaxID=35708 RepID=A0A0A9ETI8_ARUDO
MPMKYGRKLRDDKRPATDCGPMRSGLSFFSLI